MPERDMLSLGVMGLGAGPGQKFFRHRRRRRRRRRPAAPLDWLRRWIGCAAGLAAPLDWLRCWIGCAAGLAAPLDWRRRWIGCAAGLFPLHWRHTACRQEEEWKGREEQWKGREEQWKGHVRVCYDYKSTLGL